MLNLKNKILKKFNFIKFRETNISFWEEVYENLDYAGIDFLQHLIEYRKIYLNQKNQVYDFSLIFFNNNEPIAIIPLSIKKIKKKYSLEGCNNNLICLGFLKDLPEKLKEKYLFYYLEIVKFIKKELKIKKITFNITCVKNESSNPLILGQLIRNNKKFFFDENQIYLKIKKNIEDIKKEFRKSYKPLINSNINKYEYGILEEKNDGIWNEFRKFHEKISGKKRKISTWNQQYKAIPDKKAFLVYLKDKGELIAFAYFFYTYDECIYASAAFSKDLKSEKKPVGHIIQFYAIMEMIKKNIKWYKIGVEKISKKAIKKHLMTSGEPVNKLSVKKEENITLFKKGFSSNLFPVLSLEIDK